MLLLELKGNPDAPVFDKTPEFRKIYGNYCGSGNNGGEPIDDIDGACQEHDMCYHYNSRDDCDCDGRFVKKLEDILKNQKLTFKQRTITQMMLIYFKRNKTKNKCEDET